MQRRALRCSLALLGSFSPDQWSEDAYIRTPPFVTEGVDGTVMIIPTSLEAERVLDLVSPALGLKKTRNGQLCYLTSRAETIRALRMFNWFVRRSWRSKELAILWALAYALGDLDRAHPPVSVQSITIMTSCGPKLVSEVMNGLRDTGDAPSRGGAFGEYTVDGAALKERLESHLEETPTQTEELVMESLCSGTGSSVNDIYNRAFPRELTVGAVYKVSEELKRDGYVQALRHFRVNERGPMRELLGSDCRNCFYGYSSAEKCFADASRNLEQTLKRYYQKELTEEERTSTYNTIKSAPFGPKVIRKVLEALTLIHHMDIMMSEKNVVNVLRKLEDWYDIEFPVHWGPGEVASNIGLGRQ
ncbi:MAG: hypothetical protein ACLP9K_02940 [Nitrososphaerales archaeon]